MIFGISKLEFAEMQKIVQNKEKIKFGTKIVLFEYFGLLIGKSNVIFEISMLEFV